MSSLLLMSFRSVAACEAVVKKQYSLLGWEYREIDSDDDNNVTGCGKMQIIESVKTCTPKLKWVCLFKSYNLIRAVSFCRKDTSIHTRVCSC